MGQEISAQASSTAPRAPSAKKKATNSPFDGPLVGPVVLWCHCCHCSVLRSIDDEEINHGEGVRKLPHCPEPRHIADGWDFGTEWPVASLSPSAGSHSTPVPPLSYALSPAPSPPLRRMHKCFFPARDFQPRVSQGTWHHSACACLSTARSSKGSVSLSTRQSDSPSPYLSV